MTRTIRWTALAIVAALALALTAMIGVTAQATPQASPAAAPAPASDDATCALAPDGTTQNPPCRPCKGREWCTCLHNGAPRVSCNPCCYATQSGTVCLD